MHIKSPLLEKIPGIVHGFGTWTEPVPSAFAADWERDRARWTQVHKTDIGEIKEAGQALGEVDALYSYAKGLPVAVMHADCTPILMARKDGQAVAAVHAGWRGTRAHILIAAWDALKKRGEKPADWVAAVGPTIGPCCYEVSEEIAADFEAEFLSLGPGLAVPSHRMLDLPAINAAELRAIGVGQIEVLRACTKCSMDDETGGPMFCSFRRDQSKTRQFSVIQRG